MKHIIKNKEIDIKDVQTALDAGYSIYAEGMGSLSESKKKIQKHQINRMWDDWIIYIENEEGNKYYLAKNLWDESSVSEELKNVIGDYIESCHRQHIDFNNFEIERFIGENSHMNLTVEDIHYIWKQEE